MRILAWPACLCPIMLQPTLTGVYQMTVVISLGPKYPAEYIMKYTSMYQYSTCIQQSLVATKLHARKTIRNKSFLPCKLGQKRDPISVPCQGVNFEPWSKVLVFFLLKTWSNQIKPIIKQMKNLIYVTHFILKWTDFTAHVIVNYI